MYAAVTPKRDPIYLTSLLSPALPPHFPLCIGVTQQIELGSMSLVPAACEEGVYTVWLEILAGRYFARLLKMCHLAEFIMAVEPVFN